MARRASAVHNLTDAFEAVADLENGEVVRNDVCEGGHMQPPGDFENDEMLGKLALNARLSAQEPPRAVPRPKGFFDTVVDG